MARYVAPSFNTADVFAAASAAHRINDGYVKLDETEYDADGNYVGIKTYANKNLVRKLLNGDFEISDSDREHGAKVRQYCNALSFKLLTGKALSEFESNMLRIADTETVSSNYDIAIVSSLPASYERSLVRQEQNVRLREASGCLNNAVGTKVELDAEIVRCNYSNQWETFFVTAIVEGAVVFFAQKKSVELGAKIRIKGKVKDHKEDRTQLSHVKVL